MHFRCAGPWPAHCWSAWPRSDAKASAHSFSRCRQVAAQLATLRPDACAEAAASTARAFAPTILAQKRPRDTGATLPRLASRSTARDASPRLCAAPAARRNDGPVARTARQRVPHHGTIRTFELTLNELSQAGKLRLGSPYAQCLRSLLDPR